MLERLTISEVLKADKYEINAIAKELDIHEASVGARRAEIIRAIKGR